jgi:hypothetical protein
MGLCEEKEKYDDRLCACSGVMSRKKYCSTKRHLTFFNVRNVSNQNITSKYGIGVLHRSTTA